MTKFALTSTRYILAVVVVAMPFTVATAERPDVGQAETTAPAPIMPSPLDPQTEALKSKILEIDSQTQEIERTLLHPPYTRVSVYFGVETPGLLVSKLSVSIDGAAPVEVKYAQKQAIALLRHGLDRVVTINSDPGVHRLHVTLTGQYADAKADAPPVQTSLDAEFKSDAQPVQLEVDMFKGNYISAPHLRLLQWTPKS